MTTWPAPESGFPCALAANLQLQHFHTLNHLSRTKGLFLSGFKTYIDMKNLFYFLLLSFLLSSCCKDYSDLIPGQDFIPADVLQAIEDNGQIIYNGYTPPALEGKYLMSPSVLVSSNFSDPYLPGHLFVDNIVEFSDFNPNDLTIKVTISEGGANGIGYGSFISGQGNNFTVYVKVDFKDISGHEVLQTEVYSGTLETGGIRNLQRSLFMVDDKGDPNDGYIGNGQGRLAIDQDEFSQKI